MAWTKDGSPVLSQGYFGHFEPELDKWIDANFRLELENPSANIPSEPYCGVGALFSANVQKRLDNADRKEWIVVSPYHIVLSGTLQIGANGGNQ